MLDRIAQTIARHRMFEAGQNVGVAVSGGADSVYLFHALRELAPRWNLRLKVLHVNHGLRGAESEEDAGFVRQLAAEFGLPFFIHEAELAGTSDNLEQAAREARLAFFGAAIESGQVDRVATGHTRADQAETVLFRFLRGAGSAGLAGVRPVTTTGIVRPILDVDRAEVLQFLRERGFSWRDDSTNLSPQFARNRIRCDLLPQLTRDWNPALVQNLAQTADWALAEEMYWEAEMTRLAGQFFIIEPDCIILETHNLRKLPTASARRLVRRAMERVKGDLRGIEFHHVEAVLALAGATEGHGRLQAPGLDIMRSFTWLRFDRPVLNRLATRNFRFPVAVPGKIPIPGTALQLCLELTENSDPSQPANSVYNKEMDGVDWHRLSGPLELRNWRPGDQYQPKSSVSQEKIKTLFQEHRIPLWERRNWPVLTDGSVIVWSRRFGPAAEFAAGPDCRVVLKLRELRIVPEPGSVYTDVPVGREE